MTHRHTRLSDLMDRYCRFFIYNSNLAHCLRKLHIFFLISTISIISNMPLKLTSAVALVASLVAAAPRPATPVVTSAAGPIPTSFGSDSAVPFSTPQPSVPTEPIISSQVTGATSHGPYSGVATTTGAPQSGPAAQSIGTLPPNPTATYYNANGQLTKEEPAPYTPAGGLGTNGSLPRYMVESDFDFESIALGLYQEWIELDLFHNGLAVFSEQDFTDAGLNAEVSSHLSNDIVIAFMLIILLGSISDRVHG